MKKVILERLAAGDHGTFGRWALPGLTFFSGELPDRNNAQDVSCIPIGIYEVRWTLSPRFKRYMYEVLGVPGRAGVRIHSANFMGDKSKGLKCQLNGCLSPGERIGWMNGQRALLLSAPATRRFEKHMNYEPFTLEIKNGIDFSRAG